MVVNVDLLLNSLDHDEELLLQLSETFLQEAPPMMEDIKDAIQKKEYEALERAAHKLKGSISIFGAHMAAGTAQELEMIGRARRASPNLTSLANRLEHEVFDLTSELSTLGQTLCTHKP